MALALPPTLGELRISVLKRCGLASEGNIPRNIQDIIDEKIRSAQQQLYQLYPYIATYVSRNIPLIDNVTDYDIPDDTETGNINWIAVRRIRDGWLYELEPGIRPYEMNALVNVPPPPAKSMPLRYEFIDQVIRIAPRADIAIYDVLVMYYFQIPPKFVDDGERTTVDGEALLQLSEILVKEHFGGQDTDRLRAGLTGYIASIKGKQGDGDGLQMGGHQSQIGKTQSRNRFNRNGNVRTGWYDWRPW